MEAALYLRISSDKTGDELGVTRQREDCLQLAERRGWTVGETFQDNDITASGKRERPGFESLLQNLGRYSVIIAWSLDRLSRSRHDTVRLIEACQERNITIALARGSDLDMSTPMGRVMADTMAAYARLEIEQEADRRIRANQQAAAMGKVYGTGRAFGYQSGNKLLEPSEAAVLREMARRVLNSHSYSEVATWANEEGYRTTQGHPWRSITVRNKLLNKRYAGVREYNGVEYTLSDDIERVFDAETWQRLQLTMRLRADPNPVSHARSYLLTGLLECGRSNEKMTGRTITDSNGGARRRSYWCPCGLTKSANALEHFVTEQVLFRLDTPDLATYIANLRTEDSILATYLSDRQAHLARLNSLVDDYASGLLDRAQFARAKATAEVELKRIEDEIDRANRERVGVALPTGQHIRQAWEQAESLAWRRSLLGLVIKKIVATPNESLPYYFVDGRRYRFDASSIAVSWLA